MSKNVEYTLDENGKIATLTINGKPAKAGFMRGLRKAQTAPYWKLYTGTDTIFAENPFSGVNVPLTPFEASIYMFCTNWYHRYERGDMSLPIQTFDDVKYILLDINSDAYYDLLD
jgi:hypothetical protein